ncbi:S1-C subfamily serine protease [Actinocrispum wychmicini]|uniref:S1-C subfamily serine protease n=1 Tax=Actinocrispum wychmicini TaxID=1213861 RepID=A0A4R2JWS1_9PSEU|nr:S1-C subfamily serine protease [Actinocrispum wychmicini]
MDPSQAAVFGRPGGVDGAFARVSQNGHHAQLRSAPPPADALVEAFSRPPELGEVLLQRPPSDMPDGPAGERALWSRDGDPWRDPGAGAMIGPPAVGRPDPEDEKQPQARGTGQLLSVPELLFGRRVKSSALVILAVVVLAIGAGGGAVGWWLAKSGNGLTSDVNLVQAQSNVERPPGSVADVARRVAPGVVSIEFTTSNEAGVGSGAVIDGKGYIVTNNHVVEDVAADPASKMTAVFQDGSRAEAKIVGRDPKTDLAVIKVQADNLTVLQFGDSDKVAVGDSVIAVGSPLGLSNTFTSGIVSALHRPRLMPGAKGGDPPIAYDAIQTDAAINHGNSGGPLVDGTGAIIGINSSIVAPGAESGSIGLGFAIQSNDTRKIVTALIKDGQVKHADIGINAVSDVSAGSSQGARVANVADNSAAQKAGIKEGDIITKVGNRVVRNSAELTVAVRQNDIGANIPVVLVRDGREMQISVVLQSD